MSKMGLLMNDLWKDARDVVVRVCHYWGDDIRQRECDTRMALRYAHPFLASVDPLSRENCYRWLQIALL